MSGGGPYALACAWKIPDRITAVKLVGGLAPLDRPETLGAMSYHARLAFALARRSYRLLWLSYGAVVGATVRHSPGIAAAWFQLTGAPADRLTLGRAGVTERLLASMREGLRQGVRGALWDVMLYARPWGFPLERVEIPVELWHGSADRIVPPHHGQALTRSLAQSNLNLAEGEGHYSLPIDHGDAILAYPDRPAQARTEATSATMPAAPLAPPASTDPAEPAPGRVRDP